MGWISEDSCLLRNSMCDLPFPDTTRGKVYHCEICSKLWKPIEGFSSHYWERIDG